MNQVIIGKRITFGVGVGGLVTFGVWIWNATHGADLQITAPVAQGLTTAIVAAGQVFIVNKFGVTTRDGTRPAE